MKKVLLILFTLVTTSIASFCYALEHSPHFYHRKSLFELHGKSGYDVVFLGDSITERAIWTELFPGIKIANRGIGGDRTDGMLKRLDTVKGTGAKKVFIMADINDIAKGVSVEDIYSNYSSIVQSLKSVGMEVFIQSTLYADRDPLWNKKVTQLNQRLITLAKEQNLTFINLNLKLSKHSKLEKQFSNDGLHINGKAYGLWAEQIKPYIQ